jgi:hypothetical protein
VFQAMDAAGKDGTIRHVMSGVNPQGYQVFSFKQPSSEDLDHDFFWRYQLDFRRVSDCGGIRGKLVCGKRRPAVWHYANGRGANSCSCYRGGTGILARTVESHFESPSETAAFKLSR